MTLAETFDIEIELADVAVTAIIKVDAGQYSVKSVILKSHLRQMVAEQFDLQQLVENERMQEAFRASDLRGRMMRDAQDEIDDEKRIQARKEMDDAIGN